MMFGDCENHQHSTNASSNLFFIPIEARIKENVDFSLSKEPFLESREICQTQLRRDFPKGYNHQLLGRNALQGVSLGFFLSESGVITVAWPAGAAPHVQSRAN